MEVLMPDINYPVLPDLRDVRLRRLGPAQVTAVGGAALEVTAEGRSVLATLAVPGFYAPVEGDIVLVIETGESAYVIGVLQASGPMTLQAPGDLHLLAPNGQVTLQAKAVSATAGEIRLTAERLWLTADRLREVFRKVRRVISETLELDAGEWHVRVGEEFSLQARRVRAAAEEDVKIDGKRIHLG
jgi:Protein of unknown function (DUF3540)